MNPLYFEVAGRGPDLVLLHGWGLNLRVWDGLVQQLRARFRVIALDLPGHGRSPWSESASSPAAQAWMIHQTLESCSHRYTLLGWSLGGQIALDLAAATPGQVERLVLVATTPKFAVGAGWPCGLSPAAMRKVAAGLRTDSRRALADFLELQTRGSAGASRVLAKLRAALATHGEPSTAALLAGLDRLAQSDLRDSLQQVRSPTLVVAGENDRITPPRASRFLAEGLPASRYVEIRRGAHAPFLSHQKEFTGALEKFLRGRPFAGTARTRSRAGPRIRAQIQARARERRP